jgi:type IV pilus assembly protein PilO
MNKYMAQLAALDWVKVLLIGLALAVGYYFLIFDDGTALQTSIKQAQERLAAAKLSLSQTEKAMENANRFEKEVQATAAQFAKITEYMPETLSVAELNTIISKNAQLSGVRPRINPKGEEPPQGFTQAVKMEIQLEGSFAQIETFLANVSRERRLLIFDNVEITPNSAGTFPTSLGASLTFKGSLSGYRYLKNASGPPDDPAPAPAPGGK